MAEVFEVAWADFYKRIVKDHLPNRVSSMQEMYKANLIEYPPAMSFKVVDVTPGSVLVPAPNARGVSVSHGIQPANAPLTHVMQASAATGYGGGPADTQRGSLSQ